ncbi:MAG: glyoxylase-like metal-dependent hydrolase (beta-lactamase superfamily II) [Oceanicoccus sp.]|jgi:glyoxylase-like metal-dependent hydrolase (beta-lactamase superfamily II)
MKKSLTIMFAMLAALLSAQLVTADQHQAAFKATPINQTLTLLQGKGGNVLLSQGEDGLLIIDDDYADMAPVLKTALDRYGEQKFLKYIINTHWHGDHTGANEALGQGVTIVAHENVRTRLSQPQEVALFKMKSDAYPKHALPSLTYPDSMQIHFNKDKLTLQHLANGHTDGDTVVFFEQANVVHMGDHLFYPMFPFVDLASGGNVLAYANNVGGVLDYIDDKTVVIPGHGPLTNKKGLTRFHQMLNGTIAEVQAMHTAGRSLEQAQQQGLTKQWDKWNGGFIKQDLWISFIYQSL